MDAIATAESRMHEAQMVWASALGAAKDAEAALAARVQAKQQALHAWAALLAGPSERLAAAESAKDDADLAWALALHAKDSADAELGRAAAAKRTAEYNWAALLRAAAPPANPIKDLEVHVEPADLDGNLDDGPADGAAAEAAIQTDDNLLVDQDQDDSAPDQPADDAGDPAGQPGGDHVVATSPRLPNELIREIFAILQRDKKLATLAACVRGCRSFRGIGMELLWKEVSLTLDPVAPNSSIRKWKGFLAGAKKKSQWELVNELDLGRAVRGWQLQPEALKVQLSVLDQLRNLEVLKMDARYEQYWPKVERLSALRVLWITVRDRDSAAWLRSVSIPKTVHELHLQEFTGVFDMEDNFRALYRSIGASASVVDVHFAGTPSRALFCDAFVAKIRSFDLGRNRPGHFGPLVAHASFRPAELKLNRTSDWDRLDWSAINNMAGLERLVLNGFTHTFLPESFPKVEELELIYQHRPKDGIQCDARHCTVLAEPDPDYWRSIGKVHVDWQIPKPEDGFCFTAGGRSLRDDSLKRWESERAFWKKVAALTGGRFH